MKRSILQILRSPVGGLFRHVGDLTRTLAERGHQVGIVVDSLSADALTAARLEALRPFATLGIHVSPMPRLLGPGDLSTTLKVRRLAKELGIDILHGHGAKGGLYARLARGERVAIYTPHGGVLHFSPRSPSGMTFNAIERWLQGRTDAIIFESSFAKRTYAERIAELKGRVAVIHNGLSASEFVPVEPAPDAADFAYVGEFRTLKGIDYLLDALVEVTAPDGRPASLVMAGDGPDFNRFKEKIAALGLDKRVTLAGVRPAREMFARGRCIVVPSLAESLPYVVLEAAAAERPLIATNVGGIAEIFGPTADDLISPADAPSLRGVMQDHMSDPTRGGQRARTRWEFIRSRFSVAHMTDEIESVYEQALTARSPPVD